MISLIVPVYNVVDYIVEFLDSVVGQTFNNFEAVLVDDGSADGTEKILDDYAERFSDKLKVIHKTNGGVVSAWKRGIEESQGEYIAFADPDDILNPNALERLHSLMTENNADTVIACYQELKGEETIFRRTDNVGLEEGLYEGKSLENIKTNLLGNIQRKEPAFLFFKWAKLYKRSIVLENLAFTKDNVSFGDDVCINLTAIYDSERLYYSIEPVYIYRIREGSITTSGFNFKQVDDALNLIDSVRYAVKSKGYFNDFVFHNDPSYHIVRLMRKIRNLTISQKQRKKYLKTLKNHKFVTDYNLKKAKKYISSRRYIAIWCLKHSFYSVLLKIL